MILAQPILKVPLIDLLKGNWLSHIHLFCGKSTCFTARFSLGWLIWIKDINYPEMVDWAKYKLNQYLTAHSLACRVQNALYAAETSEAWNRLNCCLNNNCHLHLSKQRGVLGNYSLIGKCNFSYITTVTAECPFHYIYLKASYTSFTLSAFNLS